MAISVSQRSYNRRPSRSSYHRLKYLISICYQQREKAHEINMVILSQVWIILKISLLIDVKVQYSIYRN